MSAHAKPAQGQAILDIFRTITESVHHMVWIADAEGTLEYVNPQASKYTGLRVEELRGDGWTRTFHPDDLQICIERWTRALASGEPFEADYRLRRANGEFRWYRHVVQNMRDTQGRVVKWFGTCTDVEDQKRAIRNSELRFQSFMTNLPAGAWIKNSDLRLTWINPQDERNRGKTLDEVRGRDDFELRTPRIAQLLREQDEEVLRLQRPMQYVNSLPRADGSQNFYLVVKFPLPDAEGKPGVAGIAIDITESQQLEQTVRQLLSRLVQAQEAERHKVAADLHDLIGQKLTALGIGLDIVRGELPAGVQERHAPRLAQMSTLIEETVAAIREVMSELRPSALDDHGLTAALFQYASVFQVRTGMRVQVSGPERAELLQREIAIALFRIAQEALTNAAKHSGATRVLVHVDKSAQRVELSIDDDGHGILAQDAGDLPGTWGLRTMRERAEAVGGRLRMASSKGGTRIDVEVRLGDADRRHTG